MNRMETLEEAAELYRSTMERFPEDVVSRNGLAETLKALGRFEEAIELLQSTVERFPEDYVSKISLAHALSTLGRFEEAIEFYQYIIERFPDNVVARNGLAETLRQMAYRERIHSEPPALTSQSEIATANEKTSSSLESARGQANRYKYHVALSFAGENRDVAKELADLLSTRGITVFYDQYEQADLWGKDLYQHLQYVYRDSAKFCVIFLSEAYAKKLWTRHELKQAQARAFRENEEYILPIRLDSTEIPGIAETIGYLDIRQFSLDSIAAMLAAKLETVKK